MSVSPILLVSSIFTLFSQFFPPSKDFIKLPVCVWTEVLVEEVVPLPPKEQA